MSNKNHSNFKLPEQAERNPFSLPEDYFSTLSSRVSEKRQAEEEIRPNISLWRKVRPHIALAASILGFALISMIALQFILGDNNQQDYYDLALLDEAGILDESVLQESLEYGEEDSYTEWEQEAMAYLASNEVDLNLLLSEN